MNPGVASAGRPPAAPLAAAARAGSRQLLFGLGQQSRALSRELLIGILALDESGGHLFLKSLCGGPQISEFLLGCLQPCTQFLGFGGEHIEASHGGNVFIGCRLEEGAACEERLDIVGEQQDIRGARPAGQVELNRPLDDGVAGGGEFVFVDFDFGPHAQLLKGDGLESAVRLVVGGRGGIEGGLSRFERGEGSGALFAGGVDLVFGHRDRRDGQSQHDADNEESEEDADNAVAH